MSTYFYKENMNKKILFVLILPLVALSLSGCTPKKSLSQKTAEKMAEKAIESQTGANVDIDSNGDEVTIRSEDGNVTYSAGGNVSLPENFPKELIVAGDAKISVAISSEEGASVSYITNESQENITKKYLDSLTDAGWDKVMELSTTDGNMLSFEKGEGSITVSVGENTNDQQSEKTLVSIIYSAK